MKKLVMCLILLSAVIIPLACGNQNNAPSGPIGGTGAVATSTPTGTPTPGGPAPTATSNGFTATPSPTFAIVPPTVQHNFGTTSAPNGMVITGSLLTVAENDNVTGPMVENFTVAGSNDGTVNLAPGIGLNNYVLTTFPVPNPAPTPAYNPLPAWTPAVTGLNGPQGFVNPGGGGGYSSTLDVQGNGSAILYYGNSSTVGWNAAFYNLGYVYQPFSVTGFNSKAFKNPKGMDADSSGNVYIADTGNGLVEQFNGLAPIHSWAGNAGIVFPNVGANSFTSVVFKAPYAVGCDANSPATVYVGDNGYSPAVVQMFSSGGTTITGGFTTVSGCVIHGIAVASAANNYLIYVADSGNGQVEVYGNGSGGYPIGALLSVITDPHAAWEGNGAFSPSCIGFDANGYIWVGDSINQQIVSFK